MLNEPFRETKNFRGSLVMNINAGGGRAISLNLHVIRLFFCSFSLCHSLFRLQIINFSSLTWSATTLCKALTIYLLLQSVWIVELHVFNSLYLISKATNSLENNRNERELASTIIITHDGLTSHANGRPHTHTFLARQTTKSRPNKSDFPECLAFVCQVTISLCQI